MTSKTDTLAHSYATRTVPRYTSYPTAPHFTDAVTDGTVSRWLGALPADMPLSVYLHVPFCREMCAYCGCHTRVTRRDEPIVDYAGTLIEEIGLIGSAIGRRQPVSHIHWGGGTPSLMPADRFRSIVEALNETFAPTGTLEHAIELDPRTLSGDLLAVFADLGVNRASLGVQDFDETVQRGIGRIQPYEQVASAVERLRAAGIEAINFDLIYGLPHQTETGFAETAHLAADLAPDRISLFGYAHVPWFKKHQRLIDETALPDAEARLRLEHIARATFEARGYKAIGLDHFALPDDPLAKAAEAGTMRRNFQGYTTDTAEALVGLGASSISRLPQGYAQNAPDSGTWKRRIEDGRLASVRGRELTADDQVRGAIIEDLMTGFAADFSALAACEPEAVPDLRARLDRLRRDGLVTVNGNKVAMRPRHRSLVRIVAAEFDAYLNHGTARHSVAV